MASARLSFRSDPARSRSSSTMRRSRASGGGFGVGPRGFVLPSSPRSRARRHSVSRGAYRPSRRRSAAIPHFSLHASASRRTRFLYSAVNVRRVALSGTSVGGVGSVGEVDSIGVILAGPVL